MNMLFTLFLCFLILYAMEKIPSGTRRILCILGLVFASAYSDWALLDVYKRQAVTLITSGKDALDLLKKVDYKTLLFFVGLFVVVGGLEPVSYTHL